MSSTVTVAVHVDWLLFESVTVSVTVFVPTFVQLKSVCDSSVDCIPQASFDPLSTSWGRILTSPLIPRDIIKFWQILIGGVLSTTSTVNEQSSVLPSSSDTVKVFVVWPKGKVPPDTIPAVWTTTGLQDPVTIGWS